MTEKEFTERFQNDSENRALWSSTAAKRALALAKEAGAKFDPEPVELPVLGVREAPSEHPYCYPAAPGGILSRKEVVEVVRRCNAWPELRTLAAALLDHGQAEYTSQLLRLRELLR